MHVKHCCFFTRYPSFCRLFRQVTSVTGCGVPRCACPTPATAKTAVAGGSSNRCINALVNCQIAETNRNTEQNASTAWAAIRYVVPVANFCSGTEAEQRPLRLPKLPKFVIAIIDGSKGPPVTGHTIPVRPDDGWHTHACPCGSGPHHLFSYQRTDTARHLGDAIEILLQAMKVKVRGGKIGGPIFSSQLPEGKATATTRAEDKPVFLFLCACFLAGTLPQPGGVTAGLDFQRNC